MLHAITNSNFYDFKLDFRGYYKGCYTLRNALIKTTITIRSNANVVYSSFFS